MNSPSLPSGSTHFRIPAGGLAVRRERSDVAFRCKFGRLWITSEGDFSDYLLGPGQCYQAKAGSKVLIEALQDSELGMTRKNPNPSSTPSFAGILLSFAAVYLIWGSTYLAIRFAIESLPPFGMAASRFLLAGGILAAVLLAKRVPLPSLRQCRGAFFIGILLLVGGNGGVVWAEQSLTSGIAAILIATTPLWMMLLDRILGRKIRLKSVHLAAGVAGLAGVALLVWPSDSRLFPAVPWLPALVVLASAFWWSLGSVLSKTLELPASPWWTTSLEMIGGGMVLGLISLVRGELRGFDFSQVSLGSWLSWAYLVVFGSLVAFSAYLWILKHCSPAKVSTYAFVNPVVALFLGWSLGGESLSARIGLAAALILPSVFVLVVEKKGGPIAASAGQAEGKGLNSTLEPT